MRVTENMMAQLEAEVRNPRVVDERPDAILVECEAVDEITTLRGWWHDGESVRDIEWYEPDELREEVTE